MKYCYFSALAGASVARPHALLQQSCIKFSTAELQPMIHNQFNLQNVLLIDETETNFYVGNLTLRKLPARLSSFPLAHILF